MISIHSIKIMNLKTKFKLNWAAQKMNKNKHKNLEQWRIQENFDDYSVNEIEYLLPWFLLYFIQIEYENFAKLIEYHKCYANSIFCI